jgi:hypothetical protein
MATFAEIDNLKVVQIISVSDADCGDLEFPQSEPIGQQFIADCMIEGTWLQYSNDGEYRGRAAVIGGTYDPELDEFISPPAP